MPDATATAPAPTSTDTPAELARESFLGWYRGNTRTAYEADLRVLYRWCAGQRVDPLAVTRLQLEQFVRWQENDRHNSLPTIKRRMSVLRTFYRLSAADGHLPQSPAEHVRLPRRYTPPPPDDGLTRHELAAMMRAAQPGWHAEAALIALMGWMGLRVSEACALQIPDMLHVDAGHRILVFTGKGGKPARAPIPVPVLRVLEQTAAGRADGPLLLRRTGTPYNRRAAARVVTRLARQAGIERHVTPHWLRHGYVSNCIEAGVPLGDVSDGARHADIRMTQRYDRRRRSLDRHANYTLSAFIATAG